MRPEYKMTDPLAKAYLNTDMYGYVKKTKPTLVSLPSIWQSALILLASILGIVGIVLFSSCQATPARAEIISYTDEKIAKAIWFAEGGLKTKYPYGVKSINTCGDKEYARKICLNSIRNAKKRWVKAGMPEDFIIYMGRRYSPPNINPNWVSLVNYFLMKGK